MIAILRMFEVKVSCLLRLTNTALLLLYYVCRFNRELAMAVAGCHSSDRRNPLRDFPGVGLPARRIFTFFHCTFGAASIPPLVVDSGPSESVWRKNMRSMGCRTRGCTSVKSPGVDMYNGCRGGKDAPLGIDIRTREQMLKSVNTLAATCRAPSSVSNSPVLFSQGV